MLASTSLLEPKIYVACLASYNAGILHGKWIDASNELESIWSEIKEMLAASPEFEAEEFAIHDYEGFGDLSLSEYESIEHIHSLSEFIEEHEEIGAALLAPLRFSISVLKRRLDYTTRMLVDGPGGRSP